MKHIKKLLSLLLAAVLLLSLLAACANTTDPQTNAGDSGEQNAGQNQSAPADAGGNPNAAADGEIVDIYMQFMNTMLSTETQKVEDAINEIITKELGVRIHLNYVSWGDYATALTTSMSSGEQLDILLAGSIAPFSFQAMYSNNMAMDITDVLNEYGQDILNTIPSVYMEAFQIGGRTYGFPAWRNYSIGAQVMMRKDILDELGLYDQAMAMDSWSDFEAILQAVKEAYTDNGSGLYALCGNRSALQFNNAMIFGADAFADANPFDNLGDTTKMVYTDTDGNVSSLQANEKQKWDYQMFARWMEKGFIDPDTSIRTDTQDSLMKNGVAFSQLMAAEYGWEATKTTAWGSEACGVTIAYIPISTSFVSKFCIVIPVTSEEPEAAIRFLNYAYTHSDVMNLIDWGIEGEDYVIDENGVGQLPEGVTQVGYHNIDVTFGNFFITLPFGTQGADFRERCREILDEAEVSPYLGFAVDTSALDNEIAAITAVNEQYTYDLGSGLYTDEMYEEYLTKLDAAGLQSYLDAFQTQLDAWRASR